MASNHEDGDCQPEISGKKSSHRSSEEKHIDAKVKCPQCHEFTHNVMPCEVYMFQMRFRNELPSEL